MAVKTKDEILNSIKEKFGDDSSDEVLGFIEDVTDTFSDLEAKATDKEDWKTKYEENDKAWRTKYKERFFSPSDDNEDLSDDEDDSPRTPKTFEDLFKKED